MQVPLENWVWNYNIRNYWFGKLEWYIDLAYFAHRKLYTNKFRLLAEWHVP
jgi:hypothetical protein